jgi:uncharacterized protein YndB with AHSA1/START domain
LTGTDDGAVEHTIRISARPETVWRYWTDPERICDWWGASAVLDPSPGGICLVMLGGDAVMRGEFVELVPYRLIVFTLGWEPAEGAPPVAPGHGHADRGRRRHDTDPPPHRAPAGGA